MSTNMSSEKMAINSNLVAFTELLARKVPANSLIIYEGTFRKVLQWQPETGKVQLEIWNGESYDYDYISISECKIPGYNYEEFCSSSK